MLQELNSNIHKCVYTHIYGKRAKVREWEYKQESKMENDVITQPLGNNEIVKSCSSCYSRGCLND